MKKQPRRASAFAEDVAAALLGIMKEYGITQERIVNDLGRSKGMVSNRLACRNGLTPDVDLIASVAKLAGVSGHAMVAELAARTRAKHEGRAQDGNQKARLSRSS